MFDLFINFMTMSICCIYCLELNGYDIILKTGKNIIFWRVPAPFIINTTFDFRSFIRLKSSYIYAIIYAYIYFDVVN